MDKAMSEKEFNKWLKKDLEFYETYGKTYKVDLMRSAFNAAIEAMKKAEGEKCCFNCLHNDIDTDIELCENCRYYYNVFNDNFQAKDKE